MSPLAVPGSALGDDADGASRVDRHIALSAGTSLLLHGIVLSLLLFAWHAAPRSDPAPQAIPVTLVKAEAIAPATIETTASPPQIKTEPVPTPEPKAQPPVPSPPARIAAPRIAQPRTTQNAAQASPIAAAPSAPPRDARPVPPPNDAMTALLQDGVGGRPVGGEGAPPGGAAIRSSAKVSSDYLTVLASWLARFQNYPAEAKAKHEQGKGVVGFTIARDGHVVKIWTDESTGSSRLDNASIVMVRAAAPVPPLPKDVAGDTIDFYFPVNYTLSNYDRLFQ